MNFLSLFIYQLTGILLLALLTTGLLVYFAGPTLRSIRLFLTGLSGFVLFGLQAIFLAKLTLLTVVFAILSIGAFLISLALLGYGSLFLTWLRRDRHIILLLTVLVVMAWSVMGFVVIFGLLAPEKTMLIPDLVVAFLAMPIPIVFLIAYDTWLNIPTLRHRRWYFDDQQPVPVLEPINLINVNIHFTRVPDISPPTFEGYPVNFPGGIPLGSLFQYFIHSHNNRHRDYRKNPIQYVSGNKPLGWLLYIQAQSQRRYLDPEKNLIENAVKPHETIFAESFTD